jgi:hypothetical protein
MTRIEIQDLLAMVQATYSNFHPENKTAAVNAWTMALEDYSVADVGAAFKSYMQSDASGFAPTPGKLIDIIHTFSNRTELNEQEAWGMVRKAISNSTYHYLEEFAKLPPVVQEAVGMPENLRSIAMDENYDEEVSSSNFMRNYRAVVTRYQKISKMPQPVQERIREVNKGNPKGILQEKREEARKSAEHIYLTKEDMPSRSVNDEDIEKLREYGLI